MAVKELVTITTVTAIWGPRWRPQHNVLVHCDSIAVVHAITARSSKDAILMHLLRCIPFFSAVRNIQIRAEHIPGQHIVVADSISRNNLQVLFKDNCMRDIQEEEKELRSPLQYSAQSPSIQSKLQYTPLI